jgi:DNA repair protein RadC
MKLREKISPAESAGGHSVLLTDEPDRPGYSPPAAPRIHDMPQDERPREKLAKHGAAALDNAELMALFLSTGTRGRSAIEIGRDLVRKYGSLGALGGLPVAELAKEHGLGLAKASKLAAAFELGCRVAREQVRNTPLDTPERIHEFFGPQMRHLPQEQVMVAVLDARLKHMGTAVVSMGTVSESAAHPREILRPVITRGAHGFVLIHNHPSGDPSPSRSDETVTRRLLDAARLMQVEFLDHVIIGRPAAGRSAYYSFREAGVIG